MALNTVEIREIFPLCAAIVNDIGFTLIYAVPSPTKQWFVAAAAPELITADCYKPSSSLWGKVGTDHSVANRIARHPAFEESARPVTHLAFRYRVFEFACVVLVF